MAANNASPHGETGVWRKKHGVDLHAVKSVVINHMCFVQVHLFIRTVVFWGFGSSQQLGVPCEISCYTISAD